MENFSEHSGWMVTSGGGRDRKACQGVCRRPDAGTHARPDSLAHHTRQGDGRLCLQTGTPAAAGAPPLTTVLPAIFNFPLKFKKFEFQISKSGAVLYIAEIAYTLQGSLFFLSGACTAWMSCMLSLSLAFSHLQMTPPGRNPCHCDYKKNTNPLVK